MSVMPIQKPGRSEQTVGTPREFLDAAERWFGKMEFDLAATRENCVVSTSGWDHFGPGSCLTSDSLSANWARLAGNLWLNPPYAKIGPWAKKCAETTLAGERKIFMLIPLTTANYALEWIYPHALVIGLNPRIQFVGHDIGFPKDLMLCCYGYGPGFETWRWKGG